FRSVTNVLRILRIDGPAVLVEAVQAGLVGRQPQRVARLDVQLTGAPRRDRSDAVDIDINISVRAQMLGETHAASPTALRRGQRQMLRPDADRSGAVLRRFGTAEQIHAWRADEAGDEQRRWLAIQLQRRTD